VLGSIYDIYLLHLFMLLGAGMHYPGMVTPASAMEVVNRTGKPVFASEDYGVYFDASGGKAWARLLNQNAVRGYMSGTIAWNLGETRSLFLLSQFPCEKRCYLGISQAQDKCAEN
jgi:hypothetical protein